VGFNPPSFAAKTVGRNHSCPVFLPRHFGDGKVFQFTANPFAFKVSIKVTLQPFAPNRISSDVLGATTYLQVVVTLQPNADAIN